MTHAARVPALLLVALVLALPAFAAAQATEGTFTHVVRDGETLASIAQSYYGNPRRETVLVAENGLTAQGGAPIRVGQRLTVPFVTYHEVQAGETWPELARRFYGDARRAFALIEANGGSASEQPDEGAELLVPYPLRHVTTQGQNVVRVASVYYPGGSREDARRVRRFNNLRTMRLTRGQIVLVPVASLTLTEEGRGAIAEATGVAPRAGEVRELQASIDAELPELEEHVRRGRFPEAVALGNRFLGSRQLTGNQMVTVQRQLATAFVALGRNDLAVAAFLAALERQPDLELDSLTTSPTVLAAFQRAQAQHEEATAAAEAAAAEEAAAAAAAEAEAAVERPPPAASDGAP
ncbi:MAG: LysM domain-containing protein [Myxococcota bacterium]